MHYICLYELNFINFIHQNYKIHLNVIIHYIFILGSKIDDASTKHEVSTAMGASQPK